MLSQPGSGGPRRATRDDLANCAREPIHRPGSIQPHGILVVLTEGEHKIIQASENVHELLGVPVGELLGGPLSRLLGADRAAQLAAELARAPLRARPVFLGTLTVEAPDACRVFHAVANRAESSILLELELARATEPPADVHRILDAVSLQVKAAANLEELSRLTAAEVRRLTGFDRVLIYQFDADWNGGVIGEDGSGRFPSYLHHRFPASDIPAQARELYLQNRLRIIPDAGYQPVPLVSPHSPRTGQPLDLSFATLRSVSPVHLEYMRNMETAASMSVSILRGGRLWGLISCHHKEPRTVPFQLRETCDLLGRAFSLKLAALEHTKDYQRRLEVQSAYSKLVAVMSGRGDFAAALAEHPQQLVAFADAAGAAVLTEDGCLLLGDTPTQAQVRELADWLFKGVKQEVYSTDSLVAEYPPALAFKDKASGLLGIAVSKLHPCYVLWFRPEVIQIIKWGGDPSKSVESRGDRTILHPRRSFETWKETVREKSFPWQPSEVEGAAELRNTIVGTVLRKAEELAALNAELTRSNKELEAFSYSVSHDLRAPLRHIVGYAEMIKEGDAGKLSPKDVRCIDTIIESSEYAGRLVDKLLGFSRLGRAELQRVRVDMNVLLRETQDDLMQDEPGRNIIWKIGALPTLAVDLMMMRMAVRDLLSNAIKYTRKRDEAIIEVGVQDHETEYVFFVKDNGVGFDMAYADKLFGVFQRLHRWEDYEGTGIGLANVRRVIERHGGRTWAEGVEDQGATFYFALPKPRGE